MTVVVNQVRINKLLHAANGPVGEELTRTGIRIQNRAKRLCPVDTGRLRSSISVSTPRPTRLNVLTISVGTNVQYARYVEMGTRYMRARPYLRPALLSEVRRR